MIENEVNMDISSTETRLDELKDRLMSVLKSAADTCEVPVTLAFMHEESEMKVLAFHGDSYKTVVSSAKKILGMLDPDHGLLTIQNIRDHQQAALLLSDLEMDKVQFFAGALFRNESGNTIGAFCICDSIPRDLTEDQKHLLRMMVDGAKAHLMLYKQSELLDESSRKLETYSSLLKNSADLTFLLEPELGKITHVSDGVEEELGYSLDMLLGKPFIDIVDTDELEGDTIAQWFLIEKQHKGRYSTSVRFIDHQNRKRSYQCDFSADKNHWYVTARDISDKKYAEKGLFEIKDKLQKIVSVSTDLIYELDSESGNLSWGDELTDLLGYPHTEKFVNYDWWLDKIHPDDLERIIHDVAQTVEGDSQKSKLVYRIRTFDGFYIYVMNRVYVDRNKDGSTADIIGAIVDISELTEIIDQSKKSEKSLGEKETLLAEIHHRVKNNLSVVSGMLMLQALNETDEEVQRKLNASIGRIKTMATLHELLYQSPSFANLRIDENIEQIISSVVESFDVSVDLDVWYSMDPVELDMDDALPFSLIVNEVITNILKHAYSDGDSGLLEVSLIEEDETATLKIRDDGKGLPEDFDLDGNGTSLGMVLIQSLTKQLNGEYSYTPLDRGVEFKLVFDKSDGKGIGSKLN